MKKSNLLFSLAFMLFLSIQLNCAASKSQSKATENINSSPEEVMTTIFNVAKNKNFDLLKNLLPPEGKGTCDGDCKALCNPGNEAMKDQLRHNYITVDEFIQYFSTAQIIEEAKINGNEAKIKFTFGENNQLDEEMNMQKIEGKWYLESF